MLISNLFLQRRGGAQEKFNRGVTQSYAKFIKRAGYSFVLLLLANFLFLGCTEPENIGNLNGTWYDGYSYVTINTSAKTIEYENNYEGEITNTPNYEAVNGVLIIRITKYWEADYSNWPEVVYTETTANNNKYCALYWSSLKPHSVHMADAYEGLTHTIKATIEDANTAFTLDNAGNYVDWSITGAYNK